jgi:integrase
MNKPKSITTDVANRIRQQLSHQNRLIFDFSIETGLRISDVLHIKARDLPQKGNIFYIKENKTKKHKIIELSDELLAKVKHLWNPTRGRYAFNSPRTFYKPLHRSTYHRHLKKACKALQIDFSAHSTRKLYALNIFERTGSIFEVQKALNHKYVTTTCDYLDINLNELVQRRTYTP